MPDIQKQGLKEKVVILMQSKNIEDIRIADELIVANAAVLDKLFLDYYLTARSELRELDLLLRIKQKIPDFKVIDYL